MEEIIRDKFTRNLNLLVI